MLKRNLKLIYSIRIFQRQISMSQLLTVSIVSVLIAVLHVHVDFGNQTPLHLSANTPRKKRISVTNRSNLKEIKYLKKKF